MLSELNSSRTLIGRLQIKGAVNDPTLARLRAASLLNSVDLSAAQLTPSSIVFIRKIRDPMPGTLSLDHSNAQLPPQWNHAFAYSLRQLASKAVRPALSRTTGNEEAVIFLDRAELLASLATDLCEGVVGLRWWWRYLSKTSDSVQVVKQAWRESPEYVPGALHQLSKTHKAVEFVQLWSDAEAHQLTQLVVRTFGLHALSPLISRTVEEAKPVRSEFEVGTASRVISPGVRSYELRFTPWQRWIAKSEARQLRAEQERFLGVSLVTNAELVRARTRGFAREVEQWQESFFTPTNASDTFEAPRAVTTTLQQVPVAFDEPVKVVADEREVIKDVPVTLATDEPRCERVKIGNAVFTQEEPDAISQTVDNASDDGPLVSREPAIEASTQTAQSVGEPLDILTIETELGGLFYLINLAIFMDIYSDFTSPVERFNTDLSIWDFVAMVGADINGEQDFDDPIWTGLQDLPDLQDKNPVNPDNPINLVPNWLTEFLPQLKSRLRQALGINGEADLGKLLLQHHAKVIISATHLDVFFSLAEHPIEIRLAGLDRNPGWVPAAGRFIAFHYD